MGILHGLRRPSSGAPKSGGKGTERCLSRSFRGANFLHWSNSGGRIETMSFPDIPKRSYVRSSCDSTAMNRRREPGDTAATLRLLTMADQICLRIAIKEGYRLDRPLLRRSSLLPVSGLPQVSLRPLQGGPGCQPLISQGDGLRGRIGRCATSSPVRPRPTPSHPIHVKRPDYEDDLEAGIDYYTLLGGGETAADTDIGSAFKARIREVHHDAGGDHDAAARLVRGPRGRPTRWTLRRRTSTTSSACVLRRLRPCLAAMPRRTTPSAAPTPRLRRTPVVPAPRWRRTRAVLAPR